MMGAMQNLYPLESQYRERVWGGQRLKPHDPPIGEAWIAYGESRVAAGAQAGRSLNDLLGPELLGEAVWARTGKRFPLLIKLLDCADWLSVQVHPNDEQARKMVGEGHYGKTEAWHFLAAQPGATILVGVKPEVDAAQLAAAIRAGRVLDVAESLPVRAGDSISIPAGTLHALGPGLLLYEVQQESDTTYRVYDWDRPASAGRALHIEESVAVTRADLSGQLKHLPDLATGEAELVRSPYFVLDVLELGKQAGDTAGQGFHLLTSIQGEAQVRAGDEVVRLGQYETLLVAGATGGYEVRALGERARMLRARVPLEAEG